MKKLILVTLLLAGVAGADELSLKEPEDYRNPDPSLEANQPWAQDDPSRGWYHPDAQRPDSPWRTPGATREDEKRWEEDHD